MTSTQDMADDLADAIVGYFTGSHPCGQQSLIAAARRYQDSRKAERATREVAGTVPMLSEGHAVAGLRDLARREAGR